MKKITLLCIFIACGTCSMQAQWQQCRCMYSDPIHAFTLLGTTIYAGTEKGIIRSTDLGMQWHNKSTGLINLHSTSMATVGNLVYVGTERGLFRSSDNGETWLGTALSAVKIISLTEKENELYINLGDKIYRIKDKGKPELFSINLPFDNFIDIVIHNNTVYVHGHYGIYTTDDDGLNWKSFNNGLPVLGINALYSAGETILFTYIEADGIYRSSDNGETWSKVADYAKQPIVKFIKNNTEIKAISYTDILVSKDGGITWAKEENLWGNVQYTTAYTLNGILFLGTQGDGIYRQADNNTEWENVGTLCKSAFGISAGNKVLYATIGNTVYKSNDIGEHWQRTHIEGIPKGNDSVVYTTHKTGTNVKVLYRFKAHNTIPEIIPMPLSTIVPNTHLVYGDTIMVGTNKGILYSTDDCATWQTSTLNNIHITTLYKNGSSIFAESDKKEIFYSADNGITWQSINIPLVKRNGFIRSGTTFMSATDAGLLHSTDNGIIWENTGFMNREIIGIIRLGNTLVFGVDSTVIVSNLEGEVWYLWGDLGANIYDLAIINNTVCAGTENGVWKADIHSITTAIEYTETIETNTPFTIFPMPARDNITINNSSNSNNGAYTIINHLGENILSGIIPAHTQSYAIDIHTLPAGMYIFSMDMNGKNIQEKFVVMSK